MWDPNPGTVSRVLLYLAFRFQILVLSPVQSVAITILLVVATWDPNPDNFSGVLLFLACGTW